MIDKQAAAGDVAGFKGIKFDDLHLAYKQLCKHEKIDREVIDVDQVIEFYNRAAADLPDHNRLKGLKLPGMTTVLDGTGAKFAELFEPDSRRHWVPLAEIPEFVQKAFVAAEDKRFFEHKGVDVRSVTRAFMNTHGRRQAPGRLDHHPAGGEEPAGRRQRHLRAQDPRGDRREPHRKDAHQAGNSRNLSQLDLSRPLVVGHRPRGARLFRQAGEGPDAGRRRLHRRPDQGAGLLQSGPLPRARARAPRLCADPHEGRRLHHGGAGDRRRGRAAELHGLRAGPPRHRIPSGRRDRPRGAHPGRHRVR